MNAIPTVALIVKPGEREPTLVEALSDDDEIREFEQAMMLEVPDPLLHVYQFRKKQSDEEEHFGDFVEDLLSQPFIKPEIQQQAVQWFKSKARIETFEKQEEEATRVIADFAFGVFTQDPDKRDFLLAGPTSHVRVRVFVDARVGAVSRAA